MVLLERVALVTGAGRGIGRAIALRLAREGASVIVNDTDLSAAEDAAGQVRSLGVEAVALHADVADLDEVRSMVAARLGRFDRIDILVTNAGILGASCLVKDTPHESWARTLAVNLTGVFHCCQAVIPHMIERRRGKIVNIASLAARRMSKLGGADYTASKYGVIGFSKHLAFELAAFGINVNVVCPGPTVTDMVREKTTEEFRAQVGEQVPLGRWIEPEEQAEAVFFLASDMANMITGHVLDVEGGQLLGIAADYREDLQRRSELSAANVNARQESEAEEK
jgi:NAD(P)-dependent dehydrogenase (short-subunit alcohol dehydrogenase family)